MDLAADGGEEWRTQNNFTLSVVEPTEADRAPIVAAINKLCPAAGGGGCSQGEQDGEGIASLPGPGPGARRVDRLAVPQGWGRQSGPQRGVGVARVTLRYNPVRRAPAFGRSPHAIETLAVSVPWLEQPGAGGRADR